MPRYWVIAPFRSKDQAFFDKVWQFDLANGTISIGWHELGDVSSMSREALGDAVAKTYPASPLATRTLFANMLWAFFHEIAPGDVVIARRGRKSLAAIGTVAKTGYFAPGHNPGLSQKPDVHPNFLDVTWEATPRDLAYSSIVFPMHTLTEITQAQFQGLIGGQQPVAAPIAMDEGEPVGDPVSFVLEKYLEDFIVSNFQSIFKGSLHLYEDAEGSDGQQYTTEIGPIDILAVDKSTNEFVVIELKKGRPSDQVVGQVLRYMGWVKQTLCAPGQEVRGLVICSHHDKRLSYALTMTSNVRVKYYSVDFKLRDVA